MPRQGPRHVGDTREGHQVTPECGMASSAPLRPASSPRNSPLQHRLTCNHDAIGLENLAALGHHRPSAIGRPRLRTDVCTHGPTQPRGERATSVLIRP
jgi:hypothetical protein